MTDSSEYTGSVVVDDPLRHRLTQNLWFPVLIGVVVVVLGALRGQLESSQLLFIGLILDIAGAIILASPDLALRRHIATPEKLEEARNQLFEIEYIIRNDNNKEFIDILTDIIRKYWDGDVKGNPHSIYIRRLYPDRPEEGVRVMYSEDAETPEERVWEGDFSDLNEAVFGGEDYDWIAQQDVFFQWVGEEITLIKKHLRDLQTQGAIILILGFVLQLLSVFISP